MATTLPAASRGNDPAALPAPEIVCTIREVDCQVAIGLVSATAPGEVAAADTIVVADLCAPDVLCDRVWPFHSIVALAGDCSLLAAFEVTGESRPRAGRRAREIGSVPPHIEVLILNASQS